MLSVIREILKQDNAMPINKFEHRSQEDNPKPAVECYKDSRHKYTDCGHFETVLG